MGRGLHRLLRARLGLGIWGLFRLVTWIDVVWLVSAGFGLGAVQFEPEGAVVLQEAFGLFALGDFG
jgi:hypothetical protein